MLHSKLLAIGRIQLLGRFVAVLFFTFLVGVGRDSQGGLVLIEFDGIVTYKGQNGGFEPLPGIQVGSQISGTLQFDDNPTMYDQVNFSTTDATYVDSFPHSSFFNYTISYNGLTRELSTMLAGATGGESIINITDGGPFQSDSFYSLSRAFGGTYLDALLINLGDDSRAVFSDTGLPSSFEYSDFTESSGFYTVQDFGNGNPTRTFDIGFSITALTASPVPEPSAALLLSIASSAIVLRRFGQRFG